MIHISLLISRLPRATASRADPDYLHEPRSLKPDAIANTVFQDYPRGFIAGKVLFAYCGGAGKKLLFANGRAGWTDTDGYARKYRIDRPSPGKGKTVDKRVCTGCTPDAQL
tara:strand:- start:4413 stop:4745 length:333 start_codon:yes stop_codon:yes gene_type:complete